MKKRKERETSESRDKPLAPPQKREKTEIESAESSNASTSENNEETSAFTEEELQLLTSLESEINTLKTKFYQSMQFDLLLHLNPEQPNWNHLKVDFTNHLQTVALKLEQINFEFDTKITMGLIRSNTPLWSFSKKYHHLKKIFFHTKALLCMLDNDFNEAIYYFNKAIVYDKKFHQEFCLEDSDYLKYLDKNLFFHFLLNLYLKQDYERVLQLNTEYSLCKNLFPNSETSGLDVVNPLYTMFTTIGEEICEHEGLYLMSRFPMKSEIFFIVGKTLDILGKATEANQYLEKAYTRRATNCVFVDRHDMALLNYDKALEIYPGNYRLIIEKIKAQYFDSGDIRIINEADNFLHSIPADNARAREKFLIDLLEISNLEGNLSKQQYFIELTRTTSDPFALFRAYLALSHIEILKNQELPQDLLKHYLMNLIQNFLKLSVEIQESWIFEIENIVILLTSEQLLIDITQNRIKNFQQILIICKQLIPSYERTASIYCELLQFPDMCYQRNYLRIGTLLLQCYSRFLAIYTDSIPGITQLQQLFSNQITIMFSFLEKIFFSGHNAMYLSIHEFICSLVPILRLEREHGINHSNQEKTQYLIEHNPITPVLLKKAFSDEPQLCPTHAICLFQPNAIDSHTLGNNSDAEDHHEENNNTDNTVTALADSSIEPLINSDNNENIKDTFIAILQTQLIAFSLIQYSKNYRDLNAKTHFKNYQLLVLSMEKFFIFTNLHIEKTLQVIREIPFLHQNIDKIRNQLVLVDHFFNSLIDYSRQQRLYKNVAYITSGFFYLKRNYYIKLLEFILNFLIDESNNVSYDTKSNLLKLCKDYYSKLSEITQKDMHLFIWLTNLTADHKKPSSLKQSISILEQEQQVLHTSELERKINELQNSLDSEPLLIKYGRKTCTNIPFTLKSDVHTLLAKKESLKLPSTKNVSMHMITIVYSPFAPPNTTVTRKIIHIPISNESVDNTIFYDDLGPNTNPKLIARSQKGWDRINALSLTEKQQFTFFSPSTKPQSINEQHLHFRHSEQHAHYWLTLKKPENLIALIKDRKFAPGSKVHMISYDILSERTSCRNCKYMLHHETDNTQNSESFTAALQAELLKQKFILPGLKKQNPRLYAVVRIMALGNNFIDKPSITHKDPETRQVKDMTTLGIFEYKSPGVSSSGSRP